MRCKTLLKVLFSISLIVSSCSSEDDGDTQSNNLEERNAEIQRKEEALKEREEAVKIKEAELKLKEEEELRRKEEEERLKNEIKQGELKISSQGLERDYILRLPKSYDGTTSLPLVYALHGANGSGAGMENNSRFTELIDTENFIVVYPNALRKEVSGAERIFWNFGRRTYTNGIQNDDVIFLRDLRNHLITNYKIDTSRIYLAGLSNGGFFANTMSVFLPNEFAALGSFAGSYFEGYKDGRPSTSMKDRDVRGAVPMIFLHGLEDTIVPYNGIIESSTVTYFTALEHAQFMAERNVIFNLSGATVTKPYEGEVPNLKPTILRNDSSIEIKEWKDTTGKNADVKLITSKKGTHSWFRESNSGAINGTREIWEFFKNHPKQ